MRIEMYVDMRLGWLAGFCVGSKKDIESRADAGNFFWLTDTEESGIFMAVRTIKEW